MGGPAPSRNKKNLKFSDGDDEGNEGTGPSSSSSSNSSLSSARPPNAPMPLPVGSARKTGRRASGAIGKLYAPLSFDIEESGSDNDEVDNAMDVDGQDSGKKEEVWPPKQSKPSKPLTIPTGPRSKQKRRLLNRNDLLSTSIGGDEKEKEEIILMQMPSALSLKVKSGYDMSTFEDGQAELKEGKIGKIEIRKSGRVFLVTGNGDRHECHAGTAAYFSQYAASLSIGDTIDTHSSSSSSSSSNSSGGVNRGTEGSMYLLGPVSRKWVVTGPSV